ncbi:hypothetical protein [Streptomyces sp. DH20]|uniref:hypothetical protein n=1 Tax=Streptomyces sp. DH20 TaxID=2857009 RepID=UPI001E55446E|nr:hypothetical protein [Streptomyces sp. DH20]
MTPLADGRAQTTLSEAVRATDAVMDPERAPVKESGTLVEGGAPGPPVLRDGAGPHEEPDTVTHSGGDGELVPDEASAQRCADA